MAKRGRKPLAAGELDARREAWKSIKRHSGMSTAEIADMLGKRERTVSGYGGAYPAGWNEIKKLRQTALARAMDSLGGAVFRGSELEEAVLGEGEETVVMQYKAGPTLFIPKRKKPRYGRQPHAA